MKKIGILHAKLSRIIASMGHGDKLIIGDSGLPIPNGETAVDLALTTNIPRFLDTLDVVLKELEVERAIIAEEMQTNSGELHQQVHDRLSAIDVKAVPHSEFKALNAAGGNVAYVRTGEATPYANVALVAGVTFG